MQLEDLEKRRLFSSANADVPMTALYSVAVATLAPVASARITRTGTLLIEGSTGNDRINVSGAPGSGNVFVNDSGGFTATTSPTPTKVLYVEQTIGRQSVLQTFDSMQVKRIYIEGGAGNDTLSVGQNIKAPVTMVGGKGNDTLTGGSGGDRISGGDGDDVISASPAVLVIGDPVSSSNTVVTGSVPRIVTTTPLGLNDRIRVISVDTQSRLARVKAANGLKYSFAVTDYQPFSTLNLVATTTPVRYLLNNVSGSTWQVVNTGITESTVFENDTSADSLEGGAGNDTITAGKGPDTIIGGAGNDVLRTINRGQPAADLLTSGTDPRLFDGLSLFSIESINAN